MLKYLKNQGALHVTLALFASIVIALLSGLVVWSENRNSQTLAAESVRGIAQVLIQQIEASLDEIDTLLKITGQRYQDQDLGNTKELDRLGSLIRREILQYRSAWRVVVADAAGNQVFSSQSLKGERPNIPDWAEHEFFQRAMEGETGLMFEGPVQDQFDKVWSMLMARRISTAEGKFQGVVVAVVPVSVLGSKFPNVNLGSNGVINLRTLDIRQVIRYPDLKGYDKEVGNRNVSKTIQNLMRNDPGQSEYHYRTRAPLDNVERAYIYKKFEHSPFWLVVGRAVKDFDPGWKRWDLFLLPISVLIIGLLVWGARRLDRQSSHLNELVHQRTQALFESKNRYRELLNTNEIIIQSVPDGLVVVDLDGRIIRCNHGVLQMFGYAENELLGQTIEIMLPGRLRDFHVKQRQPFAAGGLPQKSAKGSNFLACRRDGTEFTVYTGLSRFREGDTEQIICTIHDVSQMNQALTEAQEARRLAARYENLVASSKDAIISKTLQGIVTSWNPAAEAIYGYSQQEMLGQSLARLLPDELRHEEARLMAQVAAGQSIPSFETRRRCKNGRELDILISISPIVDEQGHIIGASNIGRDITDIKRAQNELLLRLEKLARNIPGMVYQYQRWPDGRSAFPYVSAGIRHIYGIEPEQVRADARPLFAVLHPEDRARIAQALDRSAVDLTQWNEVYRVVLPTGRTLWVEGVSTPEQMPDGSVLWNGYARDITERKGVEQELLQAKQAAEEANQAKSRFLAMMSHEIRTPINGVMGYLQLMSHEPIDDKMRGYVKESLNAARLLLRVLNDVLDFSKIEAGKLGLHAEPFDLRVMLDEVHGLMQAQLAGRSLELVLAIDADLPRFALADDMRLRQILLNLTSNAIKFTERGQVMLSVRSEPLSGERFRLCLAVKDSGIGIGPQQLNNLFHAFRQADGSITRRFGGTGLGLVISQRLLKLMGSEGLQVQSVAGVGSCFSFELVLDTPSPEQQRRLAHAVPAGADPIGYPEPASEPPLQGLRILLVEDNPTNIEVAATMLELIGAEVTIAINGHDALEVLHEQGPHFDLVFMDMQMPEMDGLEATRRIKAQADWARLPVVAMTANAMEQDRQACRAAGMVDHLSKPFELDHLVRVLRQHVSR